MHRAKPTVALGVLAVLATGAGQALVTEPVGWFWLHALSWAPAFWILSRAEGWRGFAWGWLVGIATRTGAFYWIAYTVRTFSNLPTWAALLVLLAFAATWGFYLAIVGWGFSRIRTEAGTLWPFAVAAWFTACEFLNPQLFPFSQGSTWYALPSVFLITALTGTAGMTFLVMVCNAVLLQLVEWLLGGRPREAVPALMRNVLVTASLFVVAIVWSSIRLGQIDRAAAGAETVRVALVQTNQDVERRRELWRSGAAALAADVIELSRETLSEHGPIDVLVWPEQALAGSPASGHNRRVLALARERDVEIWTGSVLLERDETSKRRAFNSLYSISSDGRATRRHDKVILLPFGEYMPFVDWFPFLARIEGVGNVSPGTEPRVYERDFARVGFLICYEAIHSEFVRSYVRDEADLLVNVTHDAWFGRTAEPYQHLMLAAVQAAQFGVPLVRATTTGISAFVDAAGRMGATSGLGTREVLVAEVKPMRVASPYATLGEWFAWTCVFASALLLWRARR